MKKLLLLLVVGAFFALAQGQTVIYDYDNQSAVNSDDKLLGTDANTLRTKNFPISVLETYFTANLGGVAVDTIEVSRTNATPIEDAINILPQFVVPKGTIIFFSGYVTDFTPAKREIYLFMLSEGAYGTGGIQISSNDVFLLSGSLLDNQVLLSDDLDWVGSAGDNLHGSLDLIRGRAINNRTLTPQDISSDLEVNGNMTTYGTLFTDGLLGVSSGATFDGQVYINTDQGNNPLVINGGSGSGGARISFEDQGGQDILQYDSSSDDLVFGGNYLLRQGTVDAGTNITIGNTPNGITISASGTVSTNESAINIEDNYTELGITAGESQRDFNLALNNMMIARSIPVGEDYSILNSAYSSVGTTAGQFQDDFNDAADTQIGANISAISVNASNISQKANTNDVVLLAENQNIAGIKRFTYLLVLQNTDPQINFVDPNTSNEVVLDGIPNDDNFKVNGTHLVWHSGNMHMGSGLQIDDDGVEIELQNSNVTSNWVTNISNILYRKDNSKHVEVVIAIDEIRPGTSTYTLPVGYRPFRETRLPIAGQDYYSSAIVPAYVKITTSGVVTFHADQDLHGSLYFRFPID